MNARWLRRLVRDARGATLVEFAGSSILFLTVAFGTIESSRMIHSYNIVSNAAREGVRYASVRGAGSGRPVTATAVKAYVAGRSAGLLTASNITVTWPVDNSTGSIVRVQVQYPFTPVVALLPSATINLNSTTELVIVR